MTASGTRSRTHRAPSTSISSSTSRPASRCSSTGPAGVPYRWPEDLGPLQHLAVGDHPIEPVIVDEEVVDARRPRRRRGARVVALTDSTRSLWRCATERARTTRSLADPGWAGDDEQDASSVGQAPAAAYFANFASSCSRCFAPRPRTRRLALMSSSSMILRGANLADARQRLEHDRHLHLADGVVARASAPAAARASRTSARPSARREPCARSAAFCEGLGCAVPGSTAVEPSCAPSCRKIGSWGARTRRVYARPPKRHNARCTPYDLRFRRGLGRRSAPPQREHARQRCRCATPAGSSAPVIGRPTTR